MPGGNPRRGNAADDGLRIDGAITAEPIDETNSSDGGDFSRGCETSGPRDERRRFVIFDEAGAGRSAAGSGGTTDRNGGGTPDRAGRIDEPWSTPFPKSFAGSFGTIPPSCARCWNRFSTRPSNSR